MQRIGVPALVTPVAPSGEQKAPGWTIGDAAATVVGVGAGVGRGAVVGLATVVGLGAVVGLDVTVGLRPVVTTGRGVGLTFATARGLGVGAGRPLAGFVALVGCADDDSAARPWAAAVADDVESSGACASAPQALTPRRTARVTAATE